MLKLTLTVVRIGSTQWVPSLVANNVECEFRD